MRRAILLAVLLATLGVLYLQRAQVRAETACSEPPFREDAYIFVPVDTGDGRIIRALVDTGATSTIISRCAIEQFSLKKKTGERTKVVLANGVIEEADTWLLTFQVGPYVMLDFHAHVVDDMPAPMIVGMDVLQTANVVIYPRERTVGFLDQEARMVVE